MIAISRYVVLLLKGCRMRRGSHGFTGAGAPAKPAAAGIIADAGMISRQPQAFIADHKLEFFITAGWFIYSYCCYPGITVSLTVLLFL